MKKLMFIGIAFGGICGSWLGGKLDDSNFGLWSMLFGFVVGPLVGLWIGYKVGQTWLE